VLRGFVLMTLFNLFLLFKHYRPETKTQLDDFQVLWVLVVLYHRTPFAFANVSRCPHGRTTPSDRTPFGTGNRNLPPGRLRRTYLIPIPGR
jgi:hypothetical protein